MPNLQHKSCVTAILLVTQLFICYMIVLPKLCSPVVGIHQFRGRRQRGTLVRVQSICSRMGKPQGSSIIIQRRLAVLVTRQVDKYHSKCTTSDNVRTSVHGGQLRLKQLSTGWYVRVQGAYGIKNMERSIAHTGSTRRTSISASPIAAGRRAS
jgi:hypothetical protein